MPIPIERLLNEQGFDTPEAHAFARTIIEGLGLTRPGKIAIAEHKVAETIAALELFAAPACDTCINRLGGEHRTPVRVSKESCPVCHGSNNRLALVDLADLCSRKGLYHLLVVGGSPKFEHTVVGIVQEARLPIRFKFAYGKEKVCNEKDAAQMIRWADLMAILAPSELPHKVSERFTQNSARGRLPCIVIPHRGIVALARGLSQLIERN